jgi:hypothetical protein
MRKYLHVVVTLNSEKASTRFLFGDLDEAALKRQFIKPYRRGERILVGNDVIPLAEVTAVSIVETSEPARGAVELVDIAPPLFERLATGLSRAV